MLLKALCVLGGFAITVKLSVLGVVESNLDLQKKLKKAEDARWQEHDFRTPEWLALELATHQGTERAREICQGKLMWTRTGWARAYCSAPDGSVAYVAGYEDYGHTLVASISFPSGQRDGPLAELITDPYNKDFYLYTWHRKR